MAKWTPEAQIAKKKERFRMVKCLHVAGVKEVEEAIEDRIEEVKQFKSDSDEEADQLPCLFTQLTNPFSATNSNSTLEAQPNISNR